MIYQCRGKKRLLKDPETGLVYDMGRKVCGKSLDETISKAVAKLPPGEHEMVLTCPCPEKMRFHVVHRVPGEVKPGKFDFSKMTPLKTYDPALLEK